MIEKLPLLKRIKGTLEYLRSQILKNVDKKLKTVYLTSEVLKLNFIFTNCLFMFPGKL